MYLPGASPGDRQFLDLNLLPPGLRPRVVPVLSIALGLLAAAGVILLLWIYQLKATADGDVAGLRTDLQQAERRVAALGEPSPAGEDQQRLAALTKYQVGWSRVLQSIVASAPADVRVRDVSFVGDAGDAGGNPQAVVKGDAAEYAAVVEFADNLRSSPFVSRVGIQSMNQTGPVTPTATTIQGGPPPGIASPTPPGSTLPPTGDTPIPPTPQLVRPTRTATPTPGYPRVPTVTRLATTSTPTPGGPTRTPTPTLTPTRLPYDFIVQSKDQTCDMGAPANASGDLVTGNVLDVDGRGMSGIRVRVTSIHTDSPWSAETTSDNNGYYRFYLTKGNFQVEVVTGSSEVASELWTRSDQETGVCSWRVVFKKNNSLTPVPRPSWTTTITPTPSTTGTRTPSPTITPTPPRGTPVAGAATATSNSDAAYLAIDGDMTTAWNAGEGPYQYWQETFTTTQYVKAIALYTSQNPEGDTTHVVRFLDSNEEEIPNSAVTFSGYTYDGQMLSKSFATPIPDVQSVKIETTDGPSFVAWREVQVFPATAPTPTPSATATPRPWTDADPIGVGELQVRAFGDPPNNYDWAWFITGWVSTTDRITYTVRAEGGPGTDPEITLYEGSGTGTLTGYANGSCGPAGTDPLLTFPAKPGVTYFAKIANRIAASGTYSLTVRQGALSCTDPMAAGYSPPAVADAAASESSVPTMTEDFVQQVGAWPRGRGFAAPMLEPKPARFAGAEDAPVQQGVSFVVVLDLKPGGGP